MLLSLHNITFGYTPQKELLRSISLQLEEGKIYALMGTNGAGKTSMFNLIGGFLRAQYGEIYFGKTQITKLPPFVINRLGISRTFQDLRLITKLTLKENIILAMRHNPSDKWIMGMLPNRFHLQNNLKLEHRADELAEQFFIRDIRNSLAGEISFGEQKLLSLACCVANGASLFLLDEPVSGIQPEYRIKILTRIKELKNQSKTILLIEHNTDFISEVVDEIFFLNEGKLVKYENLESLRNDTAMMEVYI